MDRNQGPSYLGVNQSPIFMIKNEHEGIYPIFCETVASMR